MDLVCHEDDEPAGDASGGSAPGAGPPQGPVRRAASDPTVASDRRTLHNLVSLEQSCRPRPYFGTVQKSIQPHMRRTLAVWMLQVCEDQRCEHDVFPLAVRCLDCYLSRVPAQRSRLQPLGAACLLLASKLRETAPLSPVKLCVYTDNSVPAADITQWEVAVASALGWSLARVLPSDFLEPILQAIAPWVPRQPPLIRRHLHSYIALAAVESRFLFFLPSTIACACVGVAVQRLKVLDDTFSTDSLLQHLAKLLVIDLDSIHLCSRHLRSVVELSLPSCSQAPGAYRLGTPGPEVSCNPG